jgi:hypothetical protein
MSAARILYRTRQFWHILRLAPSERDLDLVQSVLTPAQFSLFSRLQPGEQSHSIKVFTKLAGAGESNSDLLVAALLHDVGKIRYPLKLWERVWIVLGQNFFPSLSKNWAKRDLDAPHPAHFWARPFVVAEQHPAWGARLARQAGGTNTSIALIRRHQESLPPSDLLRSQGEGQNLSSQRAESHGLEDCLLQKLQAADNDS